MDLSIFKVEYNGIDQCDQDNNDPIEGCSAVKRLITTLRYYALLDIVKSKDNQDIFGAFIREVYVQYLDDYSHFINEHHDLEKIIETLKEKKIFAVCNVAKCSFTSRHHSTSTNITMDGVVAFYAKSMDSLHFYIFHLFECGLRTEKMSEIDDSTDIDADSDFFDGKFHRMSTLIKERQHLISSFDRFKNNSKFNMTIQKQRKTDGSSTTFMDEMYRFLLSNNIKRTAITTFRAFIASHQYDTDSIIIDSKPELGGNIARNMNAVLVACIDNFIRTTTLHSSSFNIGLIFYYWPKYQNMEEFDQNKSSTNINNHGGYKISDLFVKQKHPDFKEEMMNYSFLNVEQCDILMIKVKEYMETKSVKKRMVNGDEHMNLKYGIYFGDGILSRHLLAVFLYTDFTDLCTHFSATFRAIKQFETLTSIKSCNSTYWWLAKSLREIVELYGEKRRPFLGTNEQKRNHVQRYGNRLIGPFFCGLSVVIPFPEFEIRLCGPTSSSKHLEVATHFAGKYGVVVQLNNTMHVSLSGSRCAWLSNFSEEDEVIFMGGHYSITIESVRVLNGKCGECQNFEPFFSALSKVNGMFNGGCVYPEDALVCGGVTVNKNEKKIILKLFDWTLGGCDLKDVIDRDIYIWSRKH